MNFVCTKCGHSVIETFSGPVIGGAFPGAACEKYGAPITENDIWAQALNASERPRWSIPTFGSKEHASQKSPIDH